MTSAAEVEASATGVQVGARTALYKLYDEDGVLAYVGITKNPEQRWAQHAADKPWWPLVTRRTVDWYETRRAAELAEEAAIKLGRPYGNRTHNDLVPVSISVEIPGQCLIGLDILRREFVEGQPDCSRDTVLRALLYRELAARGLLGEARCFHATCSSWPDGAIVPEPCGRCSVCRSWDKTKEDGGQLCHAGGQP